MTQLPMHCGKVGLLFICLLGIGGRDAKSSDEGNVDDELKQALLLVDILKSEYVRILRENAILKQGILREGNVTEEVDNSTCPAAVNATQDGISTTQSIEGVGTTWHFRRRLRPNFPFYGLYRRRMMPDYDYYGKFRRDYGDYFGPQPNDTKRPTTPTTSPLKTSTATESEASTASQAHLKENSNVTERKPTAALDPLEANDTTAATNLTTKTILVTPAITKTPKSSSNKSSNLLLSETSLAINGSAKTAKTTMAKINEGHPHNNNKSSTYVRTTQTLKHQPHNKSLPVNITTKRIFKLSTTESGTSKLANSKQTKMKIKKKSTPKRNVKHNSKASNEVVSLKHVKKQKNNNQVMSQVAHELINEIKGEKDLALVGKINMWMNNRVTPPFLRSTMKIFLEGSTRYPMPLPENHMFCYTNPENALCRTFVR